MVHKGRHLRAQLFASQAGAPAQLVKATELPAFSGVHAAVFLLPPDLAPEQSVYALIQPTEPVGGGAEELRFSRLDAGTRHSASDAGA